MIWYLLVCLFVSQTSKYWFGATENLVWSMCNVHFICSAIASRLIIQCANQILFFGKLTILLCSAALLVASLFTQISTDPSLYVTKQTLFLIAFVLFCNHANMNESLLPFDFDLLFWFWNLFMEMSFQWTESIFCIGNVKCAHCALTSVLNHKMKEIAKRTN